MRHRILGLIGGGRRRRRTLTLGLVVSLAALAVFMITNALAVHHLKFQLDGDTSTACGTVPNCETQKFDWDSRDCVSALHPAKLNEISAKTATCGTRRE